MFIGLISFVGMVVFLILGIVGAVRKSEKAKKNFIITGVCFVLLIAAVSFSDDPTETEQADNTITETETKDHVKQEEPKEKEAVAEVKEEPKPVEPEQPKEEAKEETPKEEPKEEVKEEPQLTVSQQNAIRSAEDYLSFAPFSKSGLIEQLEFEGYPAEDAKFAVEKITVDWREQAVKSAKDYLDFSSFSRQGLIDQLVFEGFSQEDALYAVEQVGL